MGLLAVPQGLRWLWTVPGLKRWIVPPLLLTAGVFAALFGVLFRWLHGLLGGAAATGYSLPPPGPDAGWLEKTLGWLGQGWEWFVNLLLGLLGMESVEVLGWFLVASLVLWYCFSIVYEAVAGPFLDEMQARLETLRFGEDPRGLLDRPTDLPVERCARYTWIVVAAAALATGLALGVERIPLWGVALATLGTLGGVVVREPRYATWLSWAIRTEGRALRSSVLAASCTALLLLSALPLYFVPVVGYFLFALLTGFATSVSLLDIPFERRGWPFRLRWRFVRRHSPALTAFGMVAGLLLSIPVLGPIFMVPSASLGGLWLVWNLDKADLDGGRS